MNPTDGWMDGWLQFILFKSHAPGFNVLFESIPKITGVEKLKSCGHFSIWAGEQKLYKEMKRTEVVCEARGLCFVRTLPREACWAVLIHLNHSFREIQLGFTRLFYELSSRLSGQSAGLWDTTSKVNLEHSRGEIGREASSIFRVNRSYKIGRYMHGALCQEQENTQISELI